MSTIGLNGHQVSFTKRHKLNESTHNKQPVIQTSSTFTSSVKHSPEHLKANFLTFGNKPVKSGLNTTSIDKYISVFDDDTKRIWTKSVELAQQSNSKEVDSIHVLKVIASETRDFLLGDESKNNFMIRSIGEKTPTLLESKKQRAILAKTIENYFSDFDKIIDEYKTPKGANNPFGVGICLTKALEGSYHTVNGFSEISEDAFSKNAIMRSLGTINDLNRFFIEIIKLAQNVENDNISHIPGLNLDEYYKQNEVSDSNPLRIQSQKALTNRGSQNLLNFEHYSKKVNTLAGVLSSGKNALFTYDKGTKPELLAHSFTHAIENNQFNTFKPHTTMVKVLDVKSIFKNGKSPIKVIEDISKYSKHQNQKAVIFIKDFEKFIGALNEYGDKTDPKYKPEVFFESNYLGNHVSIVGLVKNSLYNFAFNSSDAQKDPAIINLKDTLDQHFEKFGLGAPSPQITKEMLLSEPRLLQPIRERLQKDIIFEPEAIELAVDLSSKIRNGSMPAKAIEFLSFVAGVKSNSVDKNFQSITVDDVRHMSEIHPDLRQVIKSGNNGFPVIHNVGITLNDVGGAQQARGMVDEVIDFIHNPDKFKEIGAVMPKGVLLHGTPGNGKTLMAKAIAGEVGVPFISVSGSQFVEKFVGQGAARIRELFQFAREQARTCDQKTAIIFVDEFDSLGRKRTGDANSQEAEQTLNELLVQMDGLNNDNDVNIVVLAATNRLDMLDEALSQRPGRFDYKVEVPNPADDVQARFEILQIHAKKKRFEVTDQKQLDKMLYDLAEKTSGSSGAQLADIINKAAIHAVRNDRQTITFVDLMEAKLESKLGRVNAHKNNKQWAKNITIAHECGHAVVKKTFVEVAEELWHKGMDVDTITTDSRGNALGVVTMKPGENDSKEVFETMFANLATLYAGHIMEKSMFNINGSSGIRSDLDKATDLAYRAVTTYGMGPKTKLMAVSNNDFIKNAMQGEIKSDILLFTSQATKAAEKIIDFYDGFFEYYIGKYSQNTKVGGNNLSGEDFQIELAKWRKDHSLEGAAFKLLKDDLYQIMKEAQIPSSKDKTIGFDLKPVIKKP